MVEDKEDKKKPAYVVLVESIEALRDERPELFKEAVLAMHDYNVNGTIDTDSLSDGARLLFKAFRKGMDYYANKYAAKVKRNQENGRKNKGKKGRVDNADDNPN